ncbi:TraR/DksA C4-type zinc finger protein [Rhodobacteraceae bacterium XHP0102]|nr:TraR/DksA C4-type zinc finger protein [Rhodobacteraceae bacterium XHP0102]
MVAKLDKAALAGIRDTLMARLEQLGHRMHQLEDALDSPHSNDWAEAAKEREDDEAMEALGIEAQHEVAMIHAALARIEAGTYGVCTDCELPISEDRLEVLPFTPFCRVCAAAHAR